MNKNERFEITEQIRDEARRLIKIQTEMREHPNLPTHGDLVELGSIIRDLFEIADQVARSRHRRPKPKTLLEVFSERAAPTN